MKTIIKKCSLFFLFIPMIAFGGSKGQEAEKKISRDFTIQSNGHLAIDNKYGSIDIAIGESNRIKIDVVITVEASSVKKAQDALDRIEIQFEEGTNRVSARTDIESSSGWTSWWGSDNVEMDIDYQVLVPADIYLDLVNKFGDIFVETTNKDLKIDLSYGDIRLGDINGKLSLDMSYSEGSMSNIRDGDLDLSFSDLEMEDAQSVNLEMKYTDLVMGSATRLKVTSANSELQGMDIDELTYTGKYDDLTVDRVKIIDADCGFSGLVIGGLSQSGDFDMRYGELQIQNISRGFSSLHLNTSFTGAALNFDESAAFSVDAQNNFCDIQHEGLKVNEMIEKGTSTTFKASKGSGGGQVVVRMNYGDLSIE